MEKIIEKLMEQAEDCLKEYSKKSEWTPQDLECIYKAVKMYDCLQTIKMNNGIWDQIKDDIMADGRSARSFPTIHYGTASYARGRDAATGRYVSRRNNPVYHDGYGPNGEHDLVMRDDYRTHSSHSISDQMIQRLEGLMDQAGSDYERKKIEEVIRHIEERG